MSHDDGPAEPALGSTMQPRSGPLSLASERLRGKPGRPKGGHRLGTASAGASASSGPAQEPVAGPAGALQPRALSVKRAADYLSVSATSIRDLVASGRLRPVPLVGRRILIDRHDLDALFDRAKEQRP
jgi:excisionase family DNA binding protein